MKNEMIENKIINKDLSTEPNLTNETCCEEKPSQLLDKYISSMMTDPELEDFEAHLIECEFCLNEYERKLLILSDELEVELEYEKIKLFLRSLDDEEIPLVLGKTVGGRTLTPLLQKTK